MPKSKSTPRRSVGYRTGIMDPYVAAAAARALGKALSKKKFTKSEGSKTKTYTKRKAPRRKTRNWSGKLGGKLRPNRRPKRGRNAADVTIETVFSVTDPNSVYVGHATYAIRPVWKTFYLSVMREAYIKAGAPAQDFTDILTDGTFQIEFKGYVNELALNKLTLTTFTQDFLTNNSSLSGTADLMITLGSANNIFQYAFDHQRCRFTEMVITISIPGAPVQAQTYNLTSMYVHMMIKSNFKVQNRTLSESATTDTDVIDRNPINGYLYQIRGGNLSLKGKRTVSIAPNSNHGLIGGVAGVNAALQEPPKPWQISRLKKYRKVTLDPGVIKTSLLKQDVHVPFFRFVTMSSNYDAAAPVFGERSPGHSQIFALEKTLDQLTGDPIAVNTELDTNFVCWITYNMRSYVNPVKFQLAP